MAVYMLAMVWGEADFSGNDGTDDQLDLEGGAFGGQAGFNYQCNQWVFGIEGDVSWLDADASEISSQDPFVTVSSEIEMLASIRGRLGIAINNILLFGTAGVAFTDLDVRVVDVEPGFVSDLSASSSATGYVIGGGAEMLIAGNISARAEVLHYNFDEGQSFPGVAGGFDHELDTTVLRVGANVHLN